MLGKVSSSPFEAVGFEAALDHAPAAERHHRALQRRVGLQPDDLFEVFVDVAGAMRDDRRDDGGVDVEHAALGGALRVEDHFQLGPQCRRARARRGEEVAFALIRRDVLLDEVTHVDFAPPVALGKPAPRIVGFARQKDGVDFTGVHVHVGSPQNIRSEMGRRFALGFGGPLFYFWLGSNALSLSELNFRMRLTAFRRRRRRPSARWSSR